MPRRDLTDCGRGRYAEAPFRAGIFGPQGQSRWSALTAYTTPMAQRLDAHVDLLMVGDSLGMVLYGFDSTLPVTLDMMIQHGRRRLPRFEDSHGRRRHAVRFLSGKPGTGLPVGGAAS